MNYNKFCSELFKCKSCKRLINFRKEIVSKKRKSYKNQTYWEKPVSGFGDLNAKIILIGLAPAAHGATRTGRVFTGDKSSDFLFQCLYEANLSNQSYSNDKNDGLNLKNLYITLALKCVPPQDKPSSEELRNCSSYFDQELNFLKNKKVIITLGKVAFDACIKFFKENDNITGSYKFAHGAKYKIKDITVLGCYHPSPRNVNTKRINKKMMVSLFNKAKKLG